MQKKTFQTNFEIKEFDYEEGVFKGYANVANFKDYAGDVVINGAFQKSLDRYKATGAMPAMLYQHKSDQPIGVWTSMGEDEKGLYATGKLTKGVQLADETRLLMKDGALNGLSIGYFVKEQEYDKNTKTTFLKEVDLREVSVVTFPCNDLSRIETVKSIIELGEIPSAKQLEQVLRDAGFSRKQATAFVSHGYKSLDQSDSEAEDKYMQEIKLLTEINQLFK